MSAFHRQVAFLGYQAEVHWQFDRVADVMSWPALALNGHVAVRDAIDVMLEHEIHHLPVVRGGELLGVVSGCDLWLAKQNTPVGWQVAGLCPSVHVSTSVARALTRMRWANEDYLVVTGLPRVGIVTSADLGRAGLDAVMECAACGSHVHVRNDEGGVPFCCGCQGRTRGLHELYDDLGVGD